MASKTLFYIEPYTDGHYISHVKHVADYFIKKEEYQLVLILSPFVKLPRSYYEKVNIIIKFLNKEELIGLKKKNKILRFINEYFLIKKYLANFDASHIHYDSIDQIYFLLFLKFPFPKNIKLTGISYKIDFHYSDVFKSKHPNFKAEFKSYLKKLVLISTLKKKYIKKVFTFDKYVIPYINKRNEISQKFEHIPDPALFKEYNKTEYNIIKTHNRSYLFSHFGHISKRKGILVLLKSLLLLDSIYQKKITLLIAGKWFQPHYKEINTMVSQIQRKTKINLIVDNRYIKDTEIKSLIFASSMILCPYIYHTGSSGVLYWAAGGGKPVLSQEYGLIGYQIRNNKLGYAVDTTSPEEIKSAIMHFITTDIDNNEYFDKKKSQLFCRKNTPDLFGKKIFIAHFGKK